MKRLSIAIIALGTQACGAYLAQEPAGETVRIIEQIYDGCVEPSVRIYGVRRAESTIVDGELTEPLLVAPGSCEIDLFCYAPFSEPRDTCISGYHRDETLTYHMELRAGTEYAFRCHLDGGERIYRVDENAL